MAILGWLGLVFSVVGLALLALSPFVGPWDERQLWLQPVLLLFASAPWCSFWADLALESSIRSPS